MTQSGIEPAGIWIGSQSTEHPLSEQYKMDWNAMQNTEAYGDVDGETEGVHSWPDKRDCGDWHQLFFFDDMQFLFWTVWRDTTSIMPINQ